MAGDMGCGGRRGVVACGRAGAGCGGGRGVVGAG